jgi:hypothetical protein
VVVVVVVVVAVMVVQTGGNGGKSRAEDMVIGTFICCLVVGVSPKPIVEFSCLTVVVAVDFLGPCSGAKICDAV